MKLLTKALSKKLPALYSQEENRDPMVVAKFFCPWNQWTWYATEGGISPTIDEYVFFGLVVGDETELGYFALSELESIHGPAGLKIERDMYWSPKPLSEVKAKVGA